MNTKQTAKLTLLPLALLITGSIDSVRCLPGIALFGSSLIFFALFAALFFLLPTGFVSATLTMIDPERGGIFQWSKKAFGKKTAALAIWLQWINTMVWFPTMLSFVAGTAAYLIAPDLANNRIYLVSVIIGVFWLLTIINLRGLKTATLFASWCTLFGMVIPMLGIIILGLIWIAHGHPMHIHFTKDALLPSLNHQNHWVSLTAIMAAYLGIELATVHVSETKHPARTFPRALTLSVTLILVTMILGALSIAVVIPTHSINLVAGTMQTIHYYLNAYHLQLLEPLLIILILIGSLGSMVNWLISPAKGLLQAAEDNFLPAFFCHHNKKQVPSRLLITQAILITLIAAAFVLMPSINASYWLLTDLSTQLYMLMYLILFASAAVLYWRHHLDQSLVSKKNVVPGGRVGFSICCAMGAIGSLVSIVVGFFRPGDIQAGSEWHYFLLMAIGMLVLTAPVALLWWYQSRRLRSFVAHQTSESP